MPYNHCHHMMQSSLSSYDCRHCLSRYHTIVVIEQYDHQPATMTKDNDNDGKDDDDNDSDIEEDNGMVVHE